MERTCRFTAIIVREDDVYVARCAEFAIESQGDTVESARSNLTEAVGRFLETAEPDEVMRRLRASKSSYEFNRKSIDEISTNLDY